ncbi:pyrimidine 5'-nucleotidase [Skermanella sp. TT6]|uniref:Pyrimidine 5'-nucleotidase n=1 Tax=Skermanella cutis TaxID=2775420 RepID=A0ABX7B3I8_9PROT|nr:pyrimidine 5'-nucleotidase [Skermanella sp. TT6]QQP88673.1 pyrimidine 5'-nucleotidase [Skermanella sp. TT6]
MTATDTRSPTPLSGIDVWIFDLDNTLYPASSNLFAQIDQRMTEFIGERFDLPWDEARRRQKQFFRDYGTTLRGLMTEHDVDPIEFMDYVHDIDVTPVIPSPELDQALERLPGRKIVYTNGSCRHADNVLARLGIARHFDVIYDIVAAGYVPKPDPRPYGELVERHGIEPRRACMVEDIARNLVPAAALGMTTVWVRTEADFARPDRGGVGHGDHIHHAVDDLIEWLVGLTRPDGSPDATAVGS